MQATSPILAMSTSWTARSQTRVGPVLDSIQDLGFRRVELGYLTPPMIEAIAEEAAARGLTIQSLHNPCPWPVDAAGERIDGGVVDALASLDAAERAQAVARARATIDLARRLGARAVVVHLGQMKAPVPQRALFDLLRAGRASELAALRQRAVAEREAAKAPYLRAALASIRELGEHAGGAGVALGVETRDGYNEIPSLAEFDEVFAATAGLPVYYWHDVGHADKQRQLGLASQEAYLGRFGDRLLGVHLHDTTLDRDHQPPGQGKTDLAGLVKYLGEGVLRTLELNGRSNREQVLAGMGVLKALGLGVV